MSATLWHLFARSAWDHPATVVEVTNGEGAALTSVRFVGTGKNSHGGGGPDKKGRCSDLCSVGRRRSSQPLWWRARYARALLWPLFARSAWAQPAIVLAGTKVEGAALASISWSAWALPATVLAGTTVEGAPLASVRLFGEASGRHCGGGHDRCVCCSDL